MDKENVVYTVYTIKYYSAIRKNGILTFVTTQMNLGGGVSEICQIEEDKYHMISFIWGI